MNTFNLLFLQADQICNETLSRGQLQTSKAVGNLGKTSYLYDHKLTLAYIVIPVLAGMGMRNTPKMLIVYCELAGMRSFLL